jgi:hypothetical protein
MIQTLGLTTDTRPGPKIWTAEQDPLCDCVEHKQQNSAAAFLAHASSSTIDMVQADT